MAVYQRSAGIRPQQSNDDVDAIKPTLDQAAEDLHATLAPLRERIPAYQRLRELCEFGNGKVLYSADLIQAQLRSLRAIKDWLAMSPTAIAAWFTRVETDLCAREKSRPRNQPSWISSRYRRRYMSPEAPPDESQSLLILGLTTSANFAEIKQAYRRLAMCFHPDHCGDATTFLTITQAYATLNSKYHPVSATG